MFLFEVEEQRCILVVTEQHVHLQRLIIYENKFHMKWKMCFAVYKVNARIHKRNFLSVDTLAVLWGLCLKLAFSIGLQLSKLDDSLFLSNRIMVLL